MLNRYVRTSIIPSSAFSHVEEAGVELARAEDGGKLLLRVVSDAGINGRQLFLSPRRWNENGFFDLDVDDYDGNTLLEQIQADQIKGAPVEAGLFLEGRW